MASRTEGILAIVAFAIMFALPNIILYRKGEFKKFTTVQLVLFGAIQLSFVVFLIVQYHSGSKCSDNDLEEGGKCNENQDQGEYDEAYRVYKLFSEGGWGNFQKWYAALASNVWQDILFTMVLFCIPFPFLPEDKMGKFELFLAKLGLYKLSLAFILGSPKYVVSNYKPLEMSHYEKAEMSVIIVLLTAFIVYLIVDKMKKTKTK
jgi:hypothetical protein